ncbi:ATP-binding protein, partial [Pseudomonas avellanae]|uniref:ATP-binding protein n=2 Tax=Pseudomonas syringae group TaxID=136849 RepID=UPI0015E1A69D
MLLPFELDPEIIQHIIHSQAGSIGKAIIELVMNSVDADATALRLTMTKEGFHCADDGRGFASRNDVLRYFGRFGTPHQEGDATYGRFRLGRGQIMAHAKTRWASNDWQMTVDTRSMGYNYELDDLEHGAPGCSIEGTWYEPLNDLELMSAVQEIRDLVRYTRISVELNGRLITRDPATEKWDFEDEYAYYRAKEEGAVSIYNQGVLVRHDSSHLWGAGGLIVTKQAIALNVSRSEILRKTCPVWKAIAKVFGPLADKVSGELGGRRKTEARRARSALSLLSGGADVAKIFCHEEVITVLPGKRHITLKDFIDKAFREHKGTYTVVLKGSDIPKGEGIAGQRIIQVLHPQTLDRFGCHSVEDFE